MRFKQTNVLRHDKKYRLYTPNEMTDAYNAVVSDGSSIRAASRRYGVPVQTLRDRITGRIDVDCVTTGRTPVFDVAEEAKLYSHLNLIADLGYGYTRQEVVYLATDYAVQLGKRPADAPLILNWFEGFRSRWPDLRVTKPRALEIPRAKCASVEVVNKYFNELENVMEKYKLQETPHLIYNVDEKGFSPNHSPPYIVHGGEGRPQAVTSGKGSITTIIGAGSASGVTVPPYFVFAGMRMMPDLLNGAIPGSDGTVSATGWSNAGIFRGYLKEHFIKFIPHRDPDQHLLLFLDGHVSHIPVDLIEWAKSQNIIMFILPAHTSHILQPLDVACYSPVTSAYNKLCHAFTRGKSYCIDRYGVCGLASKDYAKGVIPENLYAGFKKTGIYPLDRSVIDSSSLTPATAFATNKDTAEISVNDVNLIPDLPLEHQSADIPNPIVTEPQEDHVQQPDSMVLDQDTSDDTRIDNDTNTNCMQTSDVSPSFFMTARLEEIKHVKKEHNKKRKTRKSVSKVVSGWAITEEENLKNLKAYLENSTDKTRKSGKRKQSSSKNKTEKSSLSNMSRKCSSSKAIESPQPGPSHFYISDDSFLGSASEDEIDSSEKCCVCKLFTPKEIRESNFIQFTQWVQCDSCPHWVHLKFCTPVRVVRHGQIFKCIHCSDNSEE